MSASFAGVAAHRPRPDGNLEAGGAPDRQNQTARLHTSRCSGASRTGERLHGGGEAGPSGASLAKLGLYRARRIQRAGSEPRAEREPSSRSSRESAQRTLETKPNISPVDRLDDGTPTRMSHARTRERHSRRALPVGVPPSLGLGGTQRHRLSPSTTPSPSPPATPSSSLAATSRPGGTQPRPSAPTSSPSSTPSRRSSTVTTRLRRRLQRRRRRPPNRRPPARRSQAT